MCIEKEESALYTLCVTLLPSHRATLFPSSVVTCLSFPRPFSLEDFEVFTWLLKCTVVSELPNICYYHIYPHEFGNSAYVEVE